MNFSRSIIVLLVASWANTTAFADDLSGAFLRLEGDLGGHFDHMTESGNYTPSDPADPWAIGGVPVNTVLGGRVEAGIDVKTAQDAIVRFGLIYSTWGGSSALSRDVAGMVFGEPSPDGQKPEWQIRIDDGGQSNHVDFTADRHYWEIMPELQFSLPGLQQNSLKLGLQPFYGEFGGGSSSNYSYMDLNDGLQDTSIANSLSGHVFGAMLTAQKDFHPAKNVRVFVSGGVGGYSTTSSATIYGVQDAVEIDRQSTLGGVRGQLALGADYDVNSHVSFGAVARLDVWSAFPSVSGKYGDWGGGDECYRKQPSNDLVCSPPQIVGAYDIIAAPMTNLFVGASLTLRP